MQLRIDGGLFLTILTISTMTISACSSGPAGSDPRRPRETPLARALRASASNAPLVVAHRGDSSTYPENTLPAFAAAISAGADLVELDFHQTRDGVLVCIHDETLDRTTDAVAQLGRKAVRVDGIDAADLARLDAGAWFGAAHAGARVPTLAAALDEIRPHAVAMIEHKAGDPERLVALLRERGEIAEVVVMSFDWSWLRSVHALAPDLTIAALGDGPFDAAGLDDIASTGASIVHWDWRDLRREDWELLHRRGYLTCVYTVDPDLALAGCASAGLSAVTTNRPGRLRELLRAAR